MKQTYYTDDELHTVFTKAEAMINFRPITTVNTDAADLQARMLQDFFVGHQSIDHPLKAADDAG